MKTKSSKLLLAALSLAIAPAVHALDIAGFVTTKLGAPIADAKVCLESDAAHCTNTLPGGEFQIRDVTGGVRTPSQRADGYALDFGTNGLSLVAPLAVKASMDWTDAEGRRVSAERNLDLARGRNGLALPSELKREGLYFVRLYTPNLTLTWKAVFLGESGTTTRLGAPSAQAGQGRLAALSKVSALPGRLVVSKTGYRTRTYQPKAEIETDASIMLTTTDDIGLNFTGNYVAKVISIDRTNRIMITQSVSSSCNGSAVVMDTSLDTNLYVFRDSKLYLWVKGDCRGQILTGTGTDPVGTWTLVNIDADLPADLKTVDCKADSSSGVDLFTSYNAVYHVTETQITGDLTLEFCPGDIYVPLFMSLVDSTVTLTKNTCKEAILKNGKGETATLTFSSAADSLKGSFAYKTTTCTFKQSLNLTDKAPTCPEPQAFQTFLPCFALSGFSDTGALTGGMKTSSEQPAHGAWPMSMEPAFGRLHFP